MDRLLDIDEEHADEGPFLWRLWERAIRTHDRTPALVSHFVEERLLGHVEGLKEAPQALNLLGPLLYEVDSTPSAAFAAHVLAQIGSPHAVAAVVTAMRTASGSHLRALARGVQLARSRSVLVVMEPSILAAPPELQAAFLDLRLWLKQPPTPALLSVLDGGDEEASAALVRSLRFAWGPTASLAPTVLSRAFASSQPSVRNAAVEVALVLGYAGALAFAWELVAREAPGAGPLLLPMATLARDGDQLAIWALQKEGLQRDALRALGYAGTAAAAQACVDALARHLHPRLATEAFSTITGVDVAEVEVPDDTPPEAFDDPETFLPIADPTSAIRFWTERRATFAPGARYMRGQPRTWPAVRDALTSGPMRRRPALAFELLVRSGRSIEIETSDFVFNQSPQLASLSGLGTEVLQRSPLVPYLSAF